MAAVATFEDARNRPGDVAEHEVVTFCLELGIGFQQGLQPPAVGDTNRKSRAGHGQPRPVERTQKSRASPRKRAIRQEERATPGVGRGWTAVEACAFSL